MYETQKGQWPVSPDGVHAHLLPYRRGRNESNYLLFGGSAQPHAGQEQVPPFFSTVAHLTVSCGAQSVQCPNARVLGRLLTDIV